MMHIYPEYRKILVNKHNHKDPNIVPKIIVKKDHKSILTNQYQYQYQSTMEDYHSENYPNTITTITITISITITPNKLKPTKRKQIPTAVIIIIMVIDRNNIDNKIIKD